MMKREAKKTPRLPPSTKKMEELAGNKNKDSSQAMGRAGKARMCKFTLLALPQHHHKSSRVSDRKFDELRFMNNHLSTNECIDFCQNQHAIRGIKNLQR